MGPGESVPDAIEGITRVSLDDKLLGSTSNAAERSNRRLRKAQNSIDSVRTRRHLEQRLALDMFHELWACRPTNTLAILHLARSDSS